MENNKISKSIKIIENENYHELESPIKKYSKETSLVEKDSNQRGFDMSKLDKWLIEHKNELPDFEKEYEDGDDFENMTDGQMVFKHVTSKFN